MNKVKKTNDLRQKNATYYKQNPVFLICKQCLQTNMEKIIHTLVKLSKYEHQQLRESKISKQEIHRP